VSNVQPTTGRAMDATSSLRLLRPLALRLTLRLLRVLLLLTLLLHDGQCEAAGAGMCTSGAGSRQVCDVSRSKDDARGTRRVRSGMFALRGCIGWCRVC
jgi:hypothetical protein